MASNTIPMKRPSQTGNKPEQKPLLDLDEDEQWRIINETGVLHKVAPETDDSNTDIPPLFLAVVLSLALTFLHGALDYAVHMQFGFTDKFDIHRVLNRQLPLLPVLFCFVYLTTQYQNRAITQALFAVGSVAAGSYLIFLTEEKQTFGAVLKGPGVAILWIYSIIQLRLGLACGSLVLTFCYYHKAWFEGVGIRGMNEL